MDFTDGRHRRGPLDAGHRLSRSDVSFRSVVNGVGVGVDGEETSLDSEDDDADQRAAAVAEPGE